MWSLHGSRGVNTTRPGVAGAHAATRSPHGSRGVNTMCPGVAGARAAMRSPHGPRGVLGPPGGPRGGCLRVAGGPDGGGDVTLASKSAKSAFGALRTLKYVVHV